MVSGPTLQQQLNQKVDEIKQAVSGLNDEKAAKTPGEGEWSAKQVLSHLTGADDALSMYEFKRFLSEETPDLGITPGSYGDVRKDAPLSELVSKLDSDYGKIGSFLAGLNDEQLNRKAHIPFLKETPLGEYPTLGQWAMGLINFHLADHVQQLKTLSQQ
jgi:DinB superfamily